MLRSLRPRHPWRQQSIQRQIVKSNRKLREPKKKDEQHADRANQILIFHAKSLLHPAGAQPTCSNVEERRFSSLP